MPELGRAGIAGVAMITCVNPQCDDYDETISILGNASLACKITELADIGRPAQPPSMISTIFNHFNANTSTSTTEKPTADSKQVPANKRKREKNDEAPPLSTAKRNAATANTATSHSLKALRKNSTCAPNTASTQSLRTLGRQNSSTSRTNSSDGRPSADDRSVSDEEEPEMKKLRMTIVQLENENKVLLKSQIERETEIRCEIAEEMSKRSDLLLQQIKRLKTQLKEKDIGESPDSVSSSNGANNSLMLQRSVKKAKRKQIDKVNEEAQEVTPSIRGRSRQYHKVITCL